MEKCHEAPLSRSYGSHPKPALRILQKWPSHGTFQPVEQVCPLLSFYLITVGPSLIYSTIWNSHCPTTSEAARHHLHFVVEELGWSSEALKSFSLLGGNSQNQQVFCTQVKAQETLSLCCFHNLLFHTYLDCGYKMRDYVKIQFHCLSSELKKENKMY